MLIILVRSRIPREVVHRVPFSGLYVQVAAPFPLEAIGDLFAAALTPPVTSPLLPSVRLWKKKVSVTQKFFQFDPNGISSDSVRPDVLGIFSLVISYAKAARNQETPRCEDQSAKFGNLDKHHVMINCLNLTRAATPHKSALNLTARI